LLGAAVFRSELPELPELDNLFNPEGVIAEAQNLAAEAFGAEHTRFLAKGYRPWEQFFNLKSQISNRSPFRKALLACSLARHLAKSSGHSPV
jgi:Orn/Lys/Arg decarboxylase, major domain